MIETEVKTLYNVHIGGMKIMKRQNRLFALLLPLLLIFSMFSACGVNTQSIASSGILISPASQTQSVESSRVVSVAPSEVSSAASSKTSSEIASVSTQAPSETPETVIESGSYTSKEDVALYIHLFGHLPGNFITKAQATALGWTGGGLESYAPGKCIGGDYFGNYEGRLPKKSNRTFAECDIDTLGASSRGAKRIVFSNDGLVYYTPDHYESFTLLYGDPNT